MSHVTAFDLGSVRRQLASSPFSRLHFSAQTGSTNDDAAAVLGTPGSSGAVFITGFQSAGRGRRARDWVAPPGSGLLFTSILPQRVPSASLWAVTFWTAICVAAGIENAVGIKVALQWPNDLLLDGAKCCGILCISRVTGDEAAVACGTGINVLRPQAAGAFDGIDPSPAFLSDRAPGITREQLLAAILRAYQAHLPLLGDPPAVARLWEARAQLAGTPYTVAVDGGGVLAATALGIGDDGSLIATAAGREQRFTLADARIVR